MTGCKPNIDPETGIAYGVLQASVLMSLYEEITLYGKNITFDEAVDNAARSIVESCDLFMPDNGLDGLHEAARQFVCDNCSFEIEEGDCSWEWEDSEGTAYGMSPLGGSAHIWITKSKWVTETRVCSPCCPNAGDLSSPTDEGEGFYCYCPPPNLYAEVEECDLDKVPLVVYKMTQKGTVSERGKQRLRESLIKQGVFSE